MPLTIQYDSLGRPPKKGEQARKPANFFFISMPRVKVLVNRGDMLFSYYRKTFLFITLTVFFLFGRSQEADTLATRQLSDVEVVEKVRPGVTREATPVQRLDKERIEQLGLQDLSEAVRRFSGVTLKDYGGSGGLKTVSIRGFGTQHTAVSYDGVTITDAQSGQVDISRFSLDNIESVSLVIGQGDEIFQTARMFASVGALQLTTSVPRFTDRRYRVAGQVKSGSFGLANPSLRYEQKISDTYALTVDGDWLRADGQYEFKVDYGDTILQEKRSNSDIRTYRSEINFYADWKQQGNLRAKAYYFDSHRGLPGSVVLYNDYHTERLQNKNTFGQLVYENQLKTRFRVKGQAKFDYSWTRYRDFHSRYQGGVQTDTYKQKETYVSAVGLYQPHQTVSISLAEDFFMNELDATTPNCVFPSRYTSLTAFSSQYKDSRLTVTAGLLGTYIVEKVEVGEAADNRKKLSPSVSLSYRVLRNQNLRVRFSYKNIFRNPTFNDLYYDRMGNSKLLPERATQYNAGLTWSSSLAGLSLDYISLTADGYYNRVHDKIVALPTMVFWKMLNMGEVKIKGIDLNVSSRFRLPADIYLQTDGSYSWQDATDRTSEGSKIYGHQIPYTPCHAGSVSVSLENPWVNVSWLLTAVGERYSLAQNI